MDKIKKLISWLQGKKKTYAIAIGGGAFNRNALPGSGDTISLTGSGMVSVGLGDF